MFSNVRPSYFHKVYEAARADHPRIADATSPYDTTPAARGTRYFLWSNGVDHAGYAIRATGELVYVFATAPGMGLGGDAVEHAVDHGATHLDCFDGYLVGFYARHGFHRVTSLPNWSPDGPDVVYMATPGNYARALDRAEQDAQ